MQTELVVLLDRIYWTGIFSRHLEILNTERFLFVLADLDSVLNYIQVKLEPFLISAKSVYVLSTRHIIFPLIVNPCTNLIVIVFGGIRASVHAKE